MDSITLRAVIAELAPYRGARFTAATSVSPWELHLELEGGMALLVCVDPEHNALYPSSEIGGGRPQRFAQTLTRTLAGTRFAGAAQAGLDRVAALTFEIRDRLGDTRRVHLVAELTGKGANLVLTTGDAPWTGKVLERLREDRSRQRARNLAIGSPYELPASPRPDPATASFETLLETLTKSVFEQGVSPRALMDAWIGISPAAARKVLELAGPHPDAAALTRAWLHFAEATLPPPGGTGSAASASGKHHGSTIGAPAAASLPVPPTAGSLFSPTLVIHPGGDAEAFCFDPTPRESGTDATRGGETHTPYPTASAAVAAAHRHFRRRGNQPHHRLQAALHRALERTRRARQAVDREEQEAAQAERLRHIGEAVLAAAHALPRGTARASVTDHRTGETIEVELDPALTVGENAERYFKRARKAERTRARGSRRRRELEKRLAALETLAADLQAAGTGNPGPEWLERARNLGIRLPETEDKDAAAVPPEDRLPSALRPRRYDLGNGWEALVGKSNRGNEILTHEIARPHDIWMHAEQTAGSHLVLRHHEKGKEPPREVLLAAAAIAAFFSKARGSGKVPVLITEKHNVRRARKSPLGTVTVGRHKTVIVAPVDPERGKKRK